MVRILRILARTAAQLALVAALAWGGWWLLMDPRSPLPPEWHPLEPLDVTHPPTALTGLKLRRALTTDGTCFAALETGATFTRMPPLEAEGDCGVDPRLRLTAAAGMTIPPLETTCRSALRLAMWLEHAVRPASEVLGAAPTAIRHQGSYNCRAIRGGTRLSSHATGSAIDVAGVTLDDGRRLELIDGWAGDGPEAAFWRGARDGACRWFVTVLGPDFNAAHADHFHLQAMGWGLCR